MPSLSIDTCRSACLGLLIGVSLATTACQNSNNTFAYVDTERLLNNYQGMVDARLQYQRQQQEWQRNVATLEQEARLALDTAQRLGPGLPPAARALQATRTRLRQQQLASYRQAVAQQQPQEMERITQPVLQHVNAYLRRYGQEHGYAMILASAQDGALLYARPELDKLL